MKTVKWTCEYCKFWERHNHEGAARDSGICRRHPPQITTRVYTLSANSDAGRSEAEVESSTETAWPEVKAGDWCGEHNLA